MILMGTRLTQRWRRRKRIASLISAAPLLNQHPDPALAGFLLAWFLTFPAITRGIKSLPQSLMVSCLAYYLTNLVVRPFGLAAMGPFFMQPNGAAGHAANVEFT